MLRTGLIFGAALSVLALAAPARAQFGAPLGMPGVLSAPEVVSGAIGAGAAHSAAQPQQQCMTYLQGRSGPQSVCVPVATPEAKAKR